jgi:DNA-binding MarR family transcriptional regulator
MSSIRHNNIMNEQDTRHYYLRFVEFLLLQKRTLADIGLLYDLTPMQTLALLLLEKPQPMHFLTTSFACDASNVTGIVDGLQHKELVNRFENPQDRRMRMVELSQHGRDLRAAILAHLTDEEDPNPVFSKLSQQELKTFFKLVDKVAG